MTQNDFVDLAGLKGGREKQEAVARTMLRKHGYVCAAEQCGAQIGYRGITAFGVWKGPVSVQGHTEQAAIVAEFHYCSPECQGFLEAVAEGVEFDLGFGAQRVFFSGYRELPHTTWFPAEQSAD